MKRKVHLKGRLKRYVQWPILMSILLLVMNLCMYPIAVKAGVVMSAFVLVYIAVVMGLYVQNRAQIYGELVSFATQYGPWICFQRMISRTHGSCGFPRRSGITGQMCAGYIWITSWRIIPLWRWRRTTAS